MTEGLYAVLGMRVAGRRIDRSSYQLGRKVISISRSSDSDSDFYDGINSTDVTRDPRRLAFRLLEQPTDIQGEVRPVVGYPLARVPRSSDNFSGPYEIPFDSLCFLRGRFPLDIAESLDSPVSGPIDLSIHVIEGRLPLEERVSIPTVTTSDPGINGALQVAQEALGYGGYSMDELVQRYIDRAPVSLADIEGESRKATITPFRHAFAYLLRIGTNLTFEKIGKRLGGRDHTTAMNSYNKIKRLLAESQ